MKWLLIIILIFVIMLIAYSFSSQYKDKYDFYDNLKSFLNQFKLNLSFKQDLLRDFLKKVKARRYFNIFIIAYQKYLNTNEIDLSEIKILDADEKNELENIVKSIGNMNSANEINQLNTFLIDIENKLRKAEMDKNKLCPMIIKLSLLFALAVAILLI